ncbi:MAG: hypothetical protein EOM53_06070 [Alphaproteobacteria bacterium]|nr:hypothetical protein [Alphaproteobacteria bacterium]
MNKLLILSSFLLLGACATYPYGMTKEEWEALPNHERAILRREESLIKTGKADLIEKTKIGPAATAEIERASKETNNE